jgi:hypothetical protein
MKPYMKDLDPDNDAPRYRETAINYLRERRVRILLVTLPPGAEFDPPAWIATPQQFVGWLMGRLTPASLLRYFTDLEDVALQAADLVLLRLARQYREGINALDIR